MDPVIIVLAAGFEQKHADIGIFGQTVRQHAARRSRAHNDVVELAFELADVLFHSMSPAGISWDTRIFFMLAQ